MTSGYMDIQMTMTLRYTDCNDIRIFRMRIAIRISDDNKEHLLPQNKLSYYFLLKIRCAYINAILVILISRLVA